MHCIDGTEAQARRGPAGVRGRARALAALGLLALLAGCAAPAPEPSRRAGEPASAGSTSRRPSMPPAPALAAPVAARDWVDFKLKAGRRLVDANPGITYLGDPPEVLFGIPVIETELNADGSIARIRVLREPVNPEARDTVQIAIEAIRRAAPFGDVSRLPRPWKWTEAFLFDDRRHFKPRSLDD